MAQLADRVDRLRLAALEVADEVPPERVAIAGVLRLEVLGAVLADDLDARLGQDCQLVDRDVLYGGDDRDPGRARLLVALEDYFGRLRDVRLEITGSDVAALGLAESPRVGEVLAEVRRRKLNGELDGRESELEAARELISAS
jgi:hypothetical protein